MRLARRTPLPKGGAQPPPPAPPTPPPPEDPSVIQSELRSDWLQSFLTLKYTYPSVSELDQLCTQAPKGQDACSLFNTTDMSDWTPSLVRNCYCSFRYNAKNAEEIVRIAEKLMNVYVFNHLVRGPLAAQWPFNKQEFAARKFQTDYAFQEAMSERFVGLYDGHLEYKPNCYRMFQFHQPMYVTPVVDEFNNTRIVIFSMDESVPPDYQMYKGYEIILIDGKPALDVIKDYGNRYYGKFRSSRTRLLRAMATRYLGTNSTTKQREFFFDRGYFFRRTVVPMADVVEYTLRDPNSTETTVITVPWLVDFLESKPFDSSKRYWSLYCARKVGPSGAAEAATNSVDDFGDRHETFSAGDFSNSGPYSELQNDKVKVVTRQRPPKLVEDGPGFAFYAFRALNKAGGLELFGVLVIETFSVDSTRTSEWRKKIHSGMLRLVQYGARRLLLDLSNNGGGRICLAQALIRIFVASMFDNVRDAFLDWKWNKVAATAAMRRQRQVQQGQFSSSFGYITVANFPDQLEEYIRALKERIPVNTPFLPDSYASPKTLLPYFPTTRWSELKLKVKCGQAGLVTMNGPLMDYCPSQREEVMFIDSFRAPNLAILTNGACGSSCAILASYIQSSDQDIPVIVVAPSYPKGKPNSPAFSFAGGQVLTSDDIFRLFRPEDLRKSVFKNLDAEAKREQRLMERMTPPAREQFNKVFVAANTKERERIKARANEPLGKLPHDDWFPRSFPVNAKMTVTFRSIYTTETKSPIPLEFHNLPATHTIKLTPRNALNPQELWRSAIAAAGWGMQVDDINCNRIRAGTFKGVDAADLSDVCATAMPAFKLGPPLQGAKYTHEDVDAYLL